MKAYILLLFLGCAACLSLGQSEATRPINLQDMQVPNAPGFMLLDAAPTVIERPMSAKAFASGIYNSFSQGNGLPRNYAVEFTPYWFIKHPKLNYLKFCGYRSEKNSPMPFSEFKRASVSAAMVNKGDSSLTTTLSFGLRSTLVSLRNPKDIEDLKKVYERMVLRLRSFNERVAALPFDPAAMGNASAYADKVREFAAAEERAMDLTRDSLKQLMTRKPVFAIDLAAASAWNFSNADYGSNKLGRAGAWMTLNFSKNLGGKEVLEKKNYLNIYLSARYLLDKQWPDSLGQLTEQGLLDAGGKLELEIDRFSLGYEYLYRLNSYDETLNSFRSAGLVKYKVREGLFLTGAFGKNFGNRDNLISMLGINWGLGSGNEKVVLPNN